MLRCSVCDEWISFEGVVNTEENFICSICQTSNTLQYLKRSHQSYDATEKY